uniref:GHMP family kinase ATP-binding protein n=1 Tax=Candidatus Avalokitesvara rifleensis TaxID=3367620 RepID=UPI0040296577
MIITRTPFRVSFFGGGTDYAAWYAENGGSVLATTINKYCYITCRYLPPFFGYKHRIVYSKREEVKTIDEIDHPSVRECMRFMKIDRGLEIHHDGDLPARSGLGSSSSFTVGFLHALYALKGQMVTKRQLALDAIHVEQERIKENVGSQDQTLAAFGGFNRIDFGGDHHIQVQPITLEAERLDQLQDHLMLCFTGFSRIASEVTGEHIKNVSRNKKALRTMHQMVEEAINILNSNRDIADFGKLLHESWLLKRGLTDKISTPQIDNIYSAALGAGAIGGKLLGAGSGGFVLFFARPEQQARIKESLNLLQVPFRFEDLGSQVIFYQPRS